MSEAGRLWAVIGATGTGKTALSLDLAEHLGNAVIVNADAMQLYRGMNIGTAKVPEHERRGIPHHLFDARDVTEEATVAWYQPAARELIADQLAQGNHVVLVGGSGLYVSSVLYDFQFPPRDEQLRARLEARAEREGVGALIADLEVRNPSVAAAVDTRNPRRVIRALEVEILGGDAQVTLPSVPAFWTPNTTIVGVQCPRDVLVARLDARVTQMWEQGLLDEVRGLLKQGLTTGRTASRAIGYAQAVRQIKGELSQDEAIAETQLLTRKFARRQVSWFKRYRDVQWLGAPDVRLMSGLS